MAKDGIYSGTREVHTFADLAHGVDVLIKKADQDPVGSYYTNMSALLLAVFTFEAYLNHLGDKTFNFWQEIESIKVLDKYNVLCKYLKLTPDFSKRPYQTLTALLKFRNAIAHGKSQILQEMKEVSLLDDMHDHTPKTFWEEYSKLENAKRAKEDISKIITEMHIAAGFGDYPFIHGVAVGFLSKKQPKPDV